jgi:hypothetical protein
MPRNLGTGSGTKLKYGDMAWKRAENYARDIIGDLNNWVVGWTDWNMLLDIKGGPNWVNFLVNIFRLVILLMLLYLPILLQAKKCFSSQSVISVIDVRLHYGTFL